jgi:hypothetical protein
MSLLWSSGDLDGTALARRSCERPTERFRRQRGGRLELVSELVQPLLEEAALRLRTDELSARLYREGVGYTFQRSGEENDAC